jgi:hypothetical protein
VSNPSKRLGTDHEVKVRDFLKANGHPYCERLALSGSRDIGDLLIPGIVIGCKNEKRIDLAGYMDEIQVQKANAGAPLGVEIVKRRGYGIARAYAVLELADFAEVIK